ncbi:MAG: hypothetical protein GY794_00915 [bacterium]|nr:hypothetical protein [bacterium]
MNDTHNTESLSTYSKCARWWPALLAPLAMVIMIIVSGQLDAGTVKVYAEPVSPPLLALATACFALRAWKTRNPLCAILTGLAFAFTCREIHFTGTDRGVKIALAILIAWTVIWRKRLAAPIANIKHVRWVLASGLTYVLCMLVQKRVFKEKYLGMIPNEDAIHIPLEEGLELVAHLLLLLSAVMGGWKSAQKSDR